MKKYKLVEICKLNKSSLKKTDSFDKILYLDTSSITENKIESVQAFTLEEAPSRAQRKVENNTIIFSTVRPNQKHFGILINPEKNFIVSSGFTTIDVNNSKEIYPLYLYHKLTQPYIVDYLQTIAQNSVSSYPSINPDDIGNLSLTFPVFSEQQKIASVLSSLDDKIALNNRINAKLEQMAKRLYDYWFVQFDFPITDEYAKSHPELVSGSPYKSTGGKMVWNEELKREIPEGWEVENLYRIAEYVNGLACQNYRPKENEDSLPVIKIKEMNEGISNDTEKVSINIPEKYKINNGDILFSWSATLEVLIWNQGNGGLNQHIFKVIPKDYFSKEFVYLQLAKYIVNFQKQAEARKTTMGHITSEHISQSRIALPPKDIINMFTKKISGIYSQKEILEQENLKLTSMRDKLLPLLMNGQVIVK